MKFLLTALILCASLAAPVFAATNDKAEQTALNAIYGEFIKAFKALDAAPLANVYADDTIYVPEQNSVGIVKGKTDVLALYQKFFDRVKKRRAALDVDFRVIERLHTSTNEVTEIVYYMVRYHPPQDTEEPISEFAGKLVMMLKKNNQLQWRVQLDMSNRADAKLYYDATPHPNFYYGEQFSELTPAVVPENNSPNAYQHTK
ncbi:nuclear transport factor 2 family protein [Shewanella avicenniae]|uniref:Nuclear transport factor 2 family protein n=1 Tax=Shewanella avicenniae TaxID=2814294 RepID=A0ABX7QUH2_9GAMM|nr:nuclear transport factor 2 family protein [Shewanella avicenniae]QSX35146.1 nuclear transport factor 2 family protein [Shewanella avicenniae]